MSRFNPRARMGRDVPHGPAFIPIISFNPRARMGRDGCICPASIGEC